MEREQEEGRFDCVADDGTVYTVIKYRTYVSRAPISGVTEWAPGESRLALLDGSHVNDRRNGSFEIYDTGELIRKI